MRSLTVHEPATTPTDKNTFICVDNIPTVCLSTSRRYRKALECCSSTAQCAEFNTRETADRWRGASARSFLTHGLAAACDRRRVTSCHVVTPRASPVIQLRTAVVCCCCFFFCFFFLGGGGAPTATWVLHHRSHSRGERRERR